MSATIEEDGMPNSTPSSVLGQGTRSDAIRSLYLAKVFLSSLAAGTLEVVGHFTVELHFTTAQVAYVLLLACFGIAKCHSQF